MLCHSKVTLNAAFVLATLLWGSSHGRADSVGLTNGDVIGGKLVSLNESELVISSENFGEMTIPRKKVEIIALGDRPLNDVITSRWGVSGQPTPRQSSSRSNAGSGGLPSLQDPRLQQQANRLMQEALGGFGGIGNLQQNTEETVRGLEDLQKDLGPGPSADALDGYIKMFRMFGGGGGSSPDASPDNGRPAKD